MKTIDAKQCTAIALGRLGENEYTVVRFDVTAWLEELPGAVIGLYNQRPGDGAAYPVAGITVDGGIVAWTVTSAELTQTGEGKCELVAIAGDVVAKSAIFRTMVFDALDGSGEAPEPWEEWQQQLIILKDEAENAADRAEEAVEHHPRINNGVWEVWDGTTEQWVSTGVQAQGPQGETGERGETGEPGPRGETGQPGADGVTFTPSVSAEGVISWTNDGSLPNPQPVNIKGPAGKDGSDGQVGATPNLTIGTVETLEPGADATAEITGTPENPVLNLGIPQGKQGADADISNLAPIIINSASGEIASFADGADNIPVDDLTVQIEPVQDLHGYDSPWPAGGGVNKINYLSCVGIGVRNGTDSIYRNNTSISGTELTINQAYGENGGILKGVGTFPLATGEYVTISGNATLTGTNMMVVGISNYNGGGTNNIATTVSVVNGKFTVTLDAKSDYDKTGIFLQPLVANSTAVVSDVMVALGQTEQPYSPYSNICPITGWTAAKVTRTAKNLLDDSIKAVFGSRLLIGATSIYDNPTYLKAGTYSITVFGVDTTFGYLMKSQNVTKTIINGTNHGSFTVDSDGYYRIDLYGNTAISGDVTGVILVPGSTYATAYEPYAWQTYSIALPSEAGTVYGGSLDVTTGMLTVTHKMWIANGETPWNAAGIGTEDVSFYTQSGYDFDTKVGDSGGYSNYFKYVYSFAAKKTIMAYANRININSGSGFTTVEELQSAFAETPLQVLYPIATPLTYQLTPTEVKTLLGQNNIWADTGDTTVKYRADTKLYIDNKITQAIAAALNS